MSTALKATFSDASAMTTPKSGKRPPPLSIRVSDAERDQLRQAAGEQSLNAYARSKLFGDKRKRSVPSQKTLAQILGQLGKSDIPTNLRSLAKSAEIGALILDEETRGDLQRACHAVQAMRDILVKELLG